MKKLQNKDKNKVNVLKNLIKKTDIIVFIVNENLIY